MDEVKPVACVPTVNIGSRVNREVHARFWERPVPMASVLRARTLGKTRGFMKALLDTGSDRILGFTMLGPEAGKKIAIVQTAMLVPGFPTRACATPS